MERTMDIPPHRLSDDLGEVRTKYMVSGGPKPSSEIGEKENAFLERVATDDKLVQSAKISEPGVFEKTLQECSSKETALDRRLARICRRTLQLSTPFKTENGEKVGMMDVVSCVPKLPFKTFKRVDPLAIFSPEEEPSSEINREARITGARYDRFIRAQPFFSNNIGRVRLVDDKHHNIFTRRERGTTTLAFIFKEGIMVAADHSSKSSVPNVIEVGPHLVATISGGSEYLLERLQRKCRAYEDKVGRRVPVAEAATSLASSVCSSMLTGGLLIGGLDEKGATLYHVNRDGGLEDVKDKRTCLGRPLEWISYATGSGATQAIVYLKYKMSYEMSVDEARDVAKAAICFASYDATEIGDSVSVYHVGSSRFKKLISGANPKKWQDKNLKHARSCPPMTYSIYPPKL